MFRERLVPLLALGALVVSGGCGDPDDDALARRPGLTGGWSTAGCEFGREPTSITLGDMTLPATPAALDEAITRIDQGGRRDFPHSYAGLEIDQQQVRAVVYRVPSAAFDDFIRQAAQNTCIQVRDAAHSTADLADWHDRVLADLPFWTDSGVRIVTIGARHDGAGVEIGTRNVERAKVELLRRYGRQAPLIFVEQGPVSPLSSTGMPTVAPPGG